MAKEKKTIIFIVEGSSDKAALENIFKKIYRRNKEIDFGFTNGDITSDPMTVLDEGFEDSITIMALPSKYRIALRTSNIIERENREIRRREKVIQIFPNTESIIRLIGAVLQDDHNEWSVGHKIFDMKEYYDKLSSIQSNLLKIKVA